MSTDTKQEKKITIFENFDISTIDLAAFISIDSGSKIKKQGSNTFLNPCPFCGSNTAFSISSKQKTTYQCFHCKKTGNAISYLRDKHGMTHQAAIKQLQSDTTPIIEPSATTEPPKDYSKLSKSIWNGAKTIKRGLNDLLVSRGFSDPVVGTMAEQIIKSIGRMNSYKGKDDADVRDWLVVPHIINERQVGIHQIALVATPTEKKTKDGKKETVLKHEKKDIGTKGYTLIPPYNFVSTTREHERKNTLVIVESFFNGVCLGLLGYTAMPIYGEGCVNAIGNASQQKFWRGFEKKYIWLDRGEETTQKKYCEKFGLSAICFEHEKPHNFDINDVFKTCGSLQSFDREVDRYIQAAIYPQKPDFIGDDGNGVESEKLHVQRTEISEKAKSVIEGTTQQKGVFNVVIAGTGTGKSEAIRFLAKQNLDQKTDEQKQEGLACCTILTDSTDNATMHWSKISDCGTNKAVTLVISDTVKDIDDEDESDSPDFGTVNCSTYAYLGTMGHYPYIFGRAGYEYTNQKGETQIRDGLNTVQDIYLDECHSLINQCQVYYPLCKTYVKKGADGAKDGLWQATNTFHFQDVKFHQWPVRKSFAKFDYQQDITDPGVNTWSQTKKIFDTLVTDMQKPIGYTPITSTLFEMTLEESISLNIETPPRGDDRPTYHEAEYINSIKSKLLNPRIICYFPTLKADGTPLDRESFAKMYDDLKAKAKIELATNAKKEKDTKKSPEQESKDIEEKASSKAMDEMRKLVAIPHQAAWIPTLAGISILPILQVMQFAQSVNAFTAGLTDEQLEDLTIICKAIGAELRLVQVEKIPFVFDTTLLKKQGKIFSESLAEIAKALSDRGLPPSLIVTWKQCNSDRAATKARLLAPGKIAQWERKGLRMAVDQIEGIAQQGEHTENKTIFAYPGATVLQGADLWAHPIAILEFSQWVDEASLRLRPGGTKEEKQAKMAKIINGMLLQQVGRLLRVSKDEWQKRNEQEATGNFSPILSVKKIVILLHNVGEEFFEFSPNSDLVHQLQIFSDTDGKYSWHSSQKEKLVPSIVDAIETALKFEQPQNWVDLDAKDAASKGDKSNLSRKQREVIGDGNSWQAAKQEKQKNKQLQRLISKGKELVSQGKSKREIFLTLHLARHKDLQAIIYQELGFSE